MGRTQTFDTNEVVRAARRAVQVAVALAPLKGLLDIERVQVMASLAVSAPAPAQASRQAKATGQGLGKAIDMVWGIGK